MAGVGRFEDLVAWQQARQLAKPIYNVTAGGDFGCEHGLRNQIQRAAVSVMNGQYC